MNAKQTVYIVDDDDGVREALGLMLDTVGQAHEAFDSATAFLEAYRPGTAGCLVADIRMPRMSGLDLQARLVADGVHLPIIFISGHGDIPMAVEAMRQGALDFIRKPFREQDLLDRINDALESERGVRLKRSERLALERRHAALTERERDVFECVADGRMNKVTASELGISERTVEIHRAAVMRKLDLRTLAELVRFRIELEGSGMASD